MSVSQPPPVIHQPSFSTTDHLEVDDVGFTTLHEGGLDPQLDVVFIHGIQGHPSETWSHRMTVPLPAKIKSKFPGIGRSRLETPTGGTESPNNAPSPDPLSGLWPAKVLSLDFPNARILTYGYDSRVSNFFGGAASQNNIVTIAGGFLNDLAAERLDARKRPLIIVSHSMGGLITKEVYTLYCLILRVELIDSSTGIEACLNGTRKERGPSRCPGVNSCRDIFRHAS